MGRIIAGLGRGVVAVVAAAALAGCGAAVDDAADDGAVADDGGSDDGATGDATGGESVVEVEGLAFGEPSLTVAAGTTVVWRNIDGVPHTATAGTPDGTTGEFDVSIPGGGEAATTLTEPGTYPYFCEIHPSMTAELVVTEG